MDSTLSLPFELEREVFELAYFNDPTQAVRLMLTAKRVHLWIEPLLYAIFRVSDSKVRPPVFSFLGHKTCPNNQFLQRFGPHARHILFQVQPVDITVLILKYCPNITNIALWAIRGVLHAHLLPLLTSLANLTQLSFDPSCFFINYSEDDPIPFDLPMFRNITHLEIISITSSWTKWHMLSLIPNLTTLAIAGETSVALISNILLECQGLQNLVIYHFDHCGHSHVLDGLEGEIFRKVTLRAYEKDLVGCWESRARDIVAARTA